MVWVEIRNHRILESNSARTASNSLSIIEAAYDWEADDVTWMGALLREIEPFLNQGLGVYALHYELSIDGTRVLLTNPLLLGCTERCMESLSQNSIFLSPGHMDAMLLGPPCQSVSQAFHRRGLPYSDFEATRQVANEIGIRDQVYVNAWEKERTGWIFSGLCDRQRTFPVRTAGSLAKVARHIAAAHRLRRAVHQRNGQASLDAEAVISERGAIMHAEGEAAGMAERALLGETARTLVEAHHRFRDSEPDQVMSTWNALVDGRWSLVHSVDRDGKRFLLARRNALDLPDPGALSSAERQVSVLCARGHTTKLIAYELGMSISSVSEHLRRALRKLGIRSRAELTAIFMGTTRA